MSAFPPARSGTIEGASETARGYVGPAVGALIAIGLFLAARRIAQEDQGAALSLSLILGALFGFVLQRSRFCFFCHWRDLVDSGDPRGALAILAALAVGLAGYTAIYGAFLPDPTGGRLPPQAHIGPVGLALVLGGLLFGAGMSISGSCISAHLYRLGEGSPTAPFALIGTAIGFSVGFLVWNSLYLAVISDAPVWWLPRSLGYSGALLVSLGALAALAWPLLRRIPPSSHAVRPSHPLRAIFVDRWPAWIGGIAVGAIGSVAYLRIAPLGVTSEIGSRVRQIAGAGGLIPERLEGLDSFRGCATIVRDALLTPNGLFVAGLVIASFASALAAGQFQPARPSPGQMARGLIGGALLGFGAMIGVGCSVGSFLSGVSAGAASGWVFGAAMFTGATAALFAGRRAGLLS